MGMICAVGDFLVRHKSPKAIPLCVMAISLVPPTFKILVNYLKVYILDAIDRWVFLMVIFALVSRYCIAL